MQSINELFSPALRVEPLVGDETVEFRLCRAGLKDPTTGKLVSPAGHTLPGRSIVKDPVNGDIEIQNVTGYKPIKRPGEKTVYDAEYDYIRFPSTSTIMCTANDLNQYYYMKRMNENRDNPFRKLKGAIGPIVPVFYEVNPKREAVRLGNKFEYKRLAFNIVADATDEELIQICYDLNKNNRLGVTVDMGKKGDDMRASLNQIVESAPHEVIMAGRDDRSKLVVYVNEAIDKHIIMFNDHEEAREWIWRAVPGEKKKKTKAIVVVEAGNNPTKGLIDYLCQKEGAEQKADIVARVKKESLVAA